MVWKCPKCSHTSRSYSAMMKHYYKKHHKTKGKPKSKGKDSRKYVFKPPRRK